jgi:hypothetical protein
MAIFRLRPLHFFQDPSPSWRLIWLFQWGLPEITQDIFFILEHHSYNKQLPLQRQLHFPNGLLILPKFQVLWESESLGSFNYVYYCQPFTPHCLLLIARPQSLSVWTFLSAYCSYFETMSDTTLKNSLPRQCPTSSLSVGVMKAVATVYKTAIALCSHWPLASKWLLPLMVTDLVFEL